MVRFGLYGYVRLAAIATAASLSLVAPGPALAEDAPPSAVTQYVEMVPTSSGPAAGPDDATRPLTPSVREQVVSSGGSDAAVLERVATSASAGAPQRDLPRSVIEGPAVDSSADETGALSAVVSATAEADDARFFALLAVLVAITSAILLEALRRPSAAPSLFATRRR